MNIHQKVEHLQRNPYERFFRITPKAVNSLESQMAGLNLSFVKAKKKAGKSSPSDQSQKTQTTQITNPKASSINVREPLDKELDRIFNEQPRGKPRGIQLAYRPRSSCACPKSSCP